MIWPFKRREPAWPPKDLADACAEFGVPVPTRDEYERDLAELKYAITSTWNTSVTFDTLPQSPGGEAMTRRAD